jgi:hypothetical protein
LIESNSSGDLFFCILHPLSTLSLHSTLHKDHGIGIVFTMSMLINPHAIEYFGKPYTRFGDSHLRNLDWKEKRWRWSGA